MYVYTNHFRFAFLNWKLQKSFLAAPLQRKLTKAIAAGGSGDG